MTATAKNYAVKADLVWVPSSALSEHVDTGNKALSSALDSIYGKIFTEAPTSPAEGQLWFDTTNGILKYYNGSSWATIIEARTPGKVFTGVCDSGETYEDAAKRVLAANEGVPGDVVIVANATPATHAETYIMVGGDSQSASNVQVALVTADTSSEVLYIASSGVHPQHIASNTTVTVALEALDAAIDASAETAIRWAEYTATSGAFAFTAGKEVPVESGDLRMLTCKIAIKGSGYISCAQETMVLSNQVIDSNSLTLTNFYSTQSSGSGLEADGLTFAISNGALAITATAVGATIPDGSTVVVWY